MGGMTPKHLFELRWTSQPQLSPDASMVAFVVTHIEQEENRYLGDVYVASVASVGSAEPVRFTHSGKTSSNPRWSPDGSSLAFTSNRDSDNPQLYLIPAAGGEATKVTNFDESVEDYRWSPDGKRIVAVVRVRHEDYKEEDERKRKPRRFTRLFYMLDDVGFIADRPRHLFSIDPSGESEPVQLTFGESEDEAPAWSPDGKKIAFTSMRHEDWDITMRSDIYVVDASGGEPERITPNDAMCGLMTWSSDGSRIAYQTSIGDDWDWPRHSQIATIYISSGERQLLTTDLDLNCAPYPSSGSPVWDGDQIYFCLEQAGATPLYKVPADGNGKPERITDGDSTVTGFDVRREVIAETRTTATVPAELFVDDRRVSHVTSNFTSLAEVQEPERYIATSKDGSEVECWILRPPGFDKHARYPVLLNVHGGPFAQYGYRFHDEFSVYAGAGYVVVYCNPRGSSGYSQEWGRAIRGPSNDQGPGLGTVDADDVMACIETALKRFDFCDPRRLGVMGGSYGGYMTSWLVGHTDIFQAALSERAVNNWISFFGSSDNGHVFKGEIGSWPSEDVEGYLKISPTTYADAINTPLMIMHSENDLRCDIEQAQYLFTLLRLQRKEVEFVRFPAESHELTRSGSPHHRVQRFEIILDWFGKHLTE